MRRRPLPPDEVRATPLRDEEYPPLDGAYQNRTYGRRLSLDAVRSFWAETFRLIDSGRAPSGLGLYIHWPFCEDRCAYCYCDSRVASSEEEQGRYLDALLEELTVFSPVFSNRKLSSLILAGGTPSQASTARLERLLEAVSGGYRFADGADKAVEATPATLSAEKTAVLARFGINRVDLGVDSLDEGVLARAGRRGQTPDSVRAACQRALAAGMRLEVGMLYGLEGQASAPLLRELRSLAALGPARVRLYGFDPRPQTRFSEEGKKLPASFEAQSKVVFAAADELMGRSGYAPSRRPWSVPSSYLGVGASAKSRCFGSGWYQHDPLGAKGAIDGRVPPFFGMPLDLSEEKRAAVITALSVLGAIRRADYRALFGEDVLDSVEISGPLRELSAEGAVEIGEDFVRVLGEGRRFLSRLYGEAVADAVGTAREGNECAPPQCRVYERGSA